MIKIGRTQEIPSKHDASKTTRMSFNRTSAPAFFSGLFRFSGISDRNELLRWFRRSRKSFLIFLQLFFKKMKMRFKMVIFTNGLQNRKHSRFLPEHFNAEIFGKLKSWHLGGLHLCHSHSLSLSHPCTKPHALSLSHFLSIPSSLLLTLSLSLSPCLILALGLPLSSMTFFVDSLGLFEAVTSKLQFGKTPDDHLKFSD